MSQEKLQTLDELVQAGDSGDTKLAVFFGNNLGHRTLETKVPIFEFYRMSEVANERGDNGEPVAQRKLDPAHARGLAAYTLKGLLTAVIEERGKRGEVITETHRRLMHVMGEQPYMAIQPIVVNLRTAGPNGKNLRGQPITNAAGDVLGFLMWLSQRDLLYVVDGQHRRKGLDMVFEFLDDVRLNRQYPSKGSLYSYTGEDPSVSDEELNVWLECLEVARALCTIALEVHLGLTVQQERQLFHDLNNLSKKVERSLALEFDTANPVNVFLKQHLIENGLIEVVSKDVTDWESDSGAMSRKDLVGVNAILFLNKTNINGAAPTIVDERMGVAKRFWEAVVQIDGFGEPGAKTKTVAAQPVVLKALAKLTHDFAFGRNKDEELLNRLLDGITDTLNFSHDNPIWRYYERSPEEREKDPMTAYLPSDDEGKNRDIGQYDPMKNWMRFGAKHNDIVPILGDMIRWQLNLPRREPRKPRAVKEKTMVADLNQ
jgi:hypothetical protein